MDAPLVNVKLKHGTASKIARRFKVTPHHVCAIAKGERTGRPSLMRAIERERQRQLEQQQADAA